MAAQREEKFNGWDENKGTFHSMPTTLQFLGRSTENSSYSSYSSPSCSSELIELDLLELGQGECLPFGWEKRLDLKQTGAIYYLNSEETDEGPEFGLHGGGKLDLELNLSTSKVLKSRKKENLCVRSNDKIAEEGESVMRLVGCHRCLMYFMVCGHDAKCPKCNGGFLLDFLHRDSISE